MVFTALWWKSPSVYLGECEGIKITMLSLFFVHVRVCVFFNLKSSLKNIGAI